MKRTTKSYEKSDFAEYINKHTLKNTTNYKVQKETPIPNMQASTERFPFEELTPVKMKKNILTGPCFNVPMKEEKAVRNAISRRHRANKGQFITRRVHAKGKAGSLIRVWRIV